MLAGSFQNKIKKLNKQLQFISSNDSTKPIGLYRITDNSIEHICGTDRSEIPEFTVYDKRGHILKGGWRRVLMILISKKLINKTKAEIIFSANLNTIKRDLTIEESSIDRALKQAAIFYDDGGIDMKKDDLIDIAAMIHKERNHAC